MKTYIQPGNSLAFTVPYASGVTSGQGVLVGALFGIAAVDGAQNAVIECQTIGVFDISKEPALAISAGARVFWDNTNRRITTTATSNYQVGIATLPALAADIAFLTFDMKAQPTAYGSTVALPTAALGISRQTPPRFINKKMQMGGETARPSPLRGIRCRL